MLQSPNQFAGGTARDLSSRLGSMATGRAILPDTQTFRAHPSALFEIRSFIRERAAAADLSEALTSDLLLAVSEAAANSIIHTTTPEIRLGWSAGDGCIRVEIRDLGVFKKRVRMPEVEGQGGHGIALMMALADEVTIKEGTPGHPGTMVRLVKCLE
jgi:anti-sigma regulatory factor (Ser/Thr protein kinase)